MNQRMNGPSILALIDEPNGPNLWRVLSPITALEKAGYPCGWDVKSNHLIGAVAPAFDGYLLPRISWPASHRKTAQAWFESCRRTGKVVIYDADDDVFTSQETHRRVELGWTEGRTVEQLEEERRERIWAMSMCDGVTVSTQRLATLVRSVLENEAPAIVAGAERLSASEAAAPARSIASSVGQAMCSTPCGIGGKHRAACKQSRHHTGGAQRLSAPPSYHQKPVIVVPNAIDLVWFRKIVRETPRQIPGLTIGWAGGRRHDRDVELMAEAWGRISARFPEVRFVVQGWVPPIILEHVPADRLVILPWMRPETYPAGLAQIDIGCAAVAPTPFNRAKSPIKCYEYAAAGAAVVASPTLYSAVIEHGHSGFIVESTEEWEASLAQLIESHSLRKMIGQRLLKVVEKRYSLANNLHRWPLAWQQIQQSASRIIQVRNVPA